MAMNGPRSSSVTKNVTEKGNGFRFRYRKRLAAVGDCDLSIIQIGGVWHWFLQCDGIALGEGVADSLKAARQAAVAAALVPVKLLYR
jgi:hypothetical protein